LWLLLVLRRLLRILLLGIGRALLISCVILGLLLGLLICPVLVLRVMYSASCACDDCRADRGTGYASTDHSSTHHIDLRIF
jgi:hypothetical protein